MSSQSRVVQTGALPPNNVLPLQPGASNIYQSGAIKANEQNQLQNALAGGKQSGGKQSHRKQSHRKKSYKGGATPVAQVQTTPVIQVQPTPSFDPNKGGSIANNTAIATLANSVQNGSAFDKTVNGNQSEVAAISAQQRAAYNGNQKGGSRGGSLHWGCLSGGKKSRKSRKSKRRKTRKNVKRHRR